MMLLLVAINLLKATIPTIVVSLVIAVEDVLAAFGQEVLVVVLRTA